MVSNILIKINPTEMEEVEEILCKMVMTIGIKTVQEVVGSNLSDLIRICQDEEEVEVDLTEVPNVNRPRVANQTVSRDSTRCFYCKEPGHIARLCLRRQEDENRLKRLNKYDGQYRQSV